MLYFYYYEFPLIQIRYYYGDFSDNYFNTTAIIANLSNHLFFCNSAALNWYDFYLSETFSFLQAPTTYWHFFRIC